MGVAREGVKGATADIRLFSLPPCRLCRGEIPAKLLAGDRKAHKIPKGRRLTCSAALVGCSN